MAPSALLPRNMLDSMQKAGIDLAELAALAELNVEDLRKPLTDAQADRFFTIAYERANNPAAGLALGMQMRPELFGVVGFSAMTSPTFGEALSRIGKYNVLVSACELDIVRHGVQAEVRMHYNGPQRPYSRCRLDIQMGSLLSFGRTFTEKPLVPLRVTLRGEPPSYHERYTQVFGCPALFDQAHDAIVFRNSDLDLPLVSANPQVTSLLDDAAERDLAVLKSPQHMAPAVREALRVMLRGAQPTIEQVASALFVSERTLQRRLAREGVQFTALLDEVRLEMARRHLAAGRESLTEIAYLLGFVDPNSFFRSFKRWTGQTPHDFRNAASPPIAPIHTKPRDDANFVPAPPTRQRPFIGR